MSVFDKIKTGLEEAIAFEQDTLLAKTRKVTTSKEGETMSILIKGMEMPKEGHLIVRIYANGEVCEPTECAGIWGKVATAVPILPHGRLIDADNLEFYRIPSDKYEYEEVLYKHDIDDAPTIIEAEEGE